VRRELGNGTLFVEQRLQIFPRYEVFGTADAVIVTDDGVIKIVDLKYGKGVLVEAEDNTQLMLYAIGGLSFDWLSSVPIHTVEAHIVQPRRNSFPSQMHRVEDLGAWVKDNEHLVARAYAGTDIAVPGAHCKWCPIKSTCRERAEANLAMASFDFAAPEPVCTGTVDGLTEQELVKIFLAIPQVRKYLDDIEAEVAKRAHEHKVPGLKFVAGRVTRKITDEALAAANLRAFGIEPYKPATFLGITEIENQLKAKGLKVIDALKGCMSVVAGKPILVSEADKREEISPEGEASKDFS
jgi:hypothetical protein